MTEPEFGNARTGLRRRRTRRHRRNHFFQRAFIISTLTLFVIGCSAVALRYLSPSIFQARQATPLEDAEQSRKKLLITNEQSFQPNTEGRLVYPYSVIPGGVEDARELKWVAEHDPVVASHYAGFDYDHARVVRLVLARSVYVSYRIGNHVYWTRRRISLHKGEKLITDGKKTLRARCGNRVEEVPQQATEASPPPIEKFDQPVRSAAGTALQTPPVPFQSALLNRLTVSGPEPNLPLRLYDPIEGSNWVPFSLPPMPAGVCSPTKNGKNGSGENNSGKKGKKGSPCGPSGPAVVPEPGTSLLVASGVLFILCLAGRKLVRP